MEHQASAAPSLGKTILIVDDDPSTRLICVTTLRRDGYTVLEAEGSSEALKIFAAHKGPIDLLLTDLMLPPPGLEFTSTQNPYPRVHGHDLIQRALTIQKTLRAILMSSLSDKDRKAYQLITDHIPFLRKPFSVETLLELVHSVLAAAPLPFQEFDSTPKAKPDVQWYG